MKLKNSLIIFIALLLITSCTHKDKINKEEVWNITFDTAKGAGVCYYAYKETIKTNTGHLTFQNRNDFAIHLTVYNKTLKGKVECEDDIEAGGLMIYEDVDPECEYSVGIRVVDGKGIDNVTVMVYGDYDLIPYVLSD